MSLSASTRLGSYEVVAQIGAGGMGEVYEARDTKLGRKVAIKVLPAAFANDPERLARFQREAKLLAALNHPNIATIYGIEHSDGVHFLIMELVPGETLADRLKSGPVPVEEALKIAVQIADALEAAHEKNIIHRDLKPANVKVTPDGKVKVLDFGLAKAFEGESGASDLANSPTLTQAATMQGVILGTAAYMSPEQARGKAVDKRTDIWAFGCVFYEMLTGKPAFDGEDTTEILAAVVKTEPDWARISGNIPLNIRTLLRRCLQKEKTLRMRDAGDARLEIQEVPKDSGATNMTRVTRTWRESVAWVTAVVLAAATLGLSIGLWRRAPNPQQAMQAVHLSTDIGADATLDTSLGASALLSPDGTRIAFAAIGSDEKRRIYIRSLDQLQSTVLPGTEEARNPFFSPDGQWIGFFAERQLKKISVQGGVAVTLCDVPTDRGGSWGEDGTIVFAPDVQSPLFEVSSTGGAPRPMTTLDRQAGESTQRWPQVLPGGKAVLFTSSSVTVGAVSEDADVAVYSIVSGQRKTVLHGGIYGRYLPSGYIVYVSEGTLFAVPFDLKRLEVTGQPAPVLEGVVTSPGVGGAQFSLSGSGNLLYVAGRPGGQNVSIYWMDRDGKFTTLRETPSTYINPAFSPDGKRLALEISDGKRRDIWLDEWEHDTLTRLTFSGERNSYPIWTPDGQRIVYSSQEKGGAYNLWWIRADGAGGPERLVESKTAQQAGSWRGDGKVLAFSQNNADTAALRIFTLTMEGDEKSGWKPGEPKPFANIGSNEVEPKFSPDGRWLAYMSNESGGYEIYVRPFPGPGGKWQISTGGGYLPKWSQDGKELFYRTLNNKIMMVTYSGTGDSFHAGKAVPWSPGQFTELGIFTYNFDPHPDGKRVAVLKAPETEHAGAANRVNLIFNFFDELRRRVPTGK